MRIALALALRNAMEVSGSVCAVLCAPCAVHAGNCPAVFESSHTSLDMWGGATPTWSETGRTLLLRLGWFCADT